MTSSNNDARVILAVASESERNDDFLWDQLKALQADMFAAGPVAVKFAYFGREGSLSSRPYISTQWVSDSDDMVDLMARARANCVCGCYVKVGDILAAALNEAKQAPVQTAIIVGDTFHGDMLTAVALAKELCALGTKLFMFQQSSPGSNSDRTEHAYRTLAELTGGAYFAFNPSVERVARRLPRLFEAVTHFAIGGTSALDALGSPPADLLLEQLTDEPMKR